MDHDAVPTKVEIDHEIERMKVKFNEYVKENPHYRLIADGHTKPFYMAMENLGFKPYLTEEQSEIFTICKLKSCTYGNKVLFTRGNRLFWGRPKCYSVTEITNKRAPQIKRTMDEKLVRNIEDKPKKGLVGIGKLAKRESKPRAFLFNSRIWPF